MEETPLKAALRRHIAPLALAAAAALPCGQAAAQPLLFRCVDADGGVVYSDRACQSEAAGEPLPKPGDPAAAERKNQNDARLQRDNALIRRYEAERQAEEDALRAAQLRQLEIAAEIARRLAAERDTKNAARNSTLPATGCDLCRTPGTDLSWPGYIR